MCVLCVRVGFLYLYYMYIVRTTRRWHDYLDWKKMAALATRRRPNSYSMFAKRRFLSLSLSLCPFLSPVERSIEQSSLRRFTIARSFLRPRLSQARRTWKVCRLSHIHTLHILCVEFSWVFFFRFDCKPLYLMLFNIPLTYSYAQYITLVFVF